MDKMVGDVRQGDGESNISIAGDVFHRLDHHLDVEINPFLSVCSKPAGLPCAENMTYGC